MSQPRDRSLIWLRLLLVGGLLAGGVSLARMGRPPEAVRGAPAEVPAFDGTRAFADLRALYDLGPRHHGSRGHARCRELITTRMVESGEGAGTAYTEDTFQYTSSLGRAETFTSVFERFGPGAAAPIVIATHYDTQALAHHDPDPSKRAQPVPAANDGGSGVAVLLELARCFGRSPPPVPVVLAFFDGEDFGGPDRPQDYCVGSRRCAEALAQAPGGERAPWFSLVARPREDRHIVHPDGRPRAVVVIDMVGERGAEFPRRQDSEDAARALADALWGTAARLGAPQFVPRVDVAITDDHTPFLLAGIPALLVIDYDYGPGNAWWHSTEDTPDKCDAEPLAAVGRVLLEWIYAGKGRLADAK